MEKSTKNLIPHITPLNITKSMSIYIAASILMWLQTHYTIPFLSEKTSQEPILFWFIVGALGIFLPLVVLAVILIKLENNKLNLNTFKERMRFKKMTLSDIKWSIIGILLSGAGCAIIMIIISSITELKHTPNFMEFEPLTKGRYWLLIVWFLYWIFNIMGEEILWRGVMLPKQEIVFKKYTWIIQGIGWSIFHIAFGLQLWLMLLPLMFIEPYIVQKTKNSWNGVIIHGIINGPSFIAIAFGII